MGNVDQRTAGVPRLIFFEMRDAAAAAFKRTYIGQCAETLRPSNQSHVLSAAWTQQLLGLRAFSIHDETRFSAIHARLHWLPLLSRTFTRCCGSACTQTCAKTRTDAALIHYKRVGHRSPPALQRALKAHRRPGRTSCCVCEITIVSSHGCGQSGKVSKTVNSGVALPRMRRTCS
jgi:hypothetical protein